MNLDDSPSDTAFRMAARAWLAENAPKFAPGAGATDPEIFKLLRAWQGAKFSAGYAGLSVSTAYGGKGLGIGKELIFAEEESRYAVAQVPVPYLTISVNGVVPILLDYGRADLINKFLLPTLRGEILWCELFSEPSAGSDIASIRTGANRDGDTWLINGQKVWSSGAHDADWGLLLARSDRQVPRHRGLSYFVVDMRSPGIEVRPIRQISGRAEFNEVFFTDLRIPDHNRVGEVGQGWQMVLSGLSIARLGSIGGSAAILGGKIIEPLRALMQSLSEEGSPSFLDSDSSARRRLADYATALAGVENIYRRLVTRVAQGKPVGSEAIVGKIMLTRWLQSMSQFGIDLAGPAGIVVAPDDSPLALIQDAFLTSPGFRIGGGTEEINLDIIAERILGLPKEASLDKNTPFDQLKTMA